MQFVELKQSQPTPEGFQNPRGFKTQTNEQHRLQNPCTRTIYLFR